MKVSKQEMILTVGLPGSGKTTWARELLKSNSNLARVNRDDLRDLISGHKYEYTPENENVVTKLQDDLIINYIRQGRDIIIDDTNLNKSTVNRLHRIANRYDLNFKLKSFLDVDINLCIERCKNRLERVVDKEVIMKMFNKYLKGKTSKQFIEDLKLYNEIKTTPVSIMFKTPNLFYKHIIVDLDGTVASHKGVRDVYDGTRVIYDVLIDNIANIVKQLSINHNIWFVSGRDGKYKDVTCQWLDKHFNIQLTNPGYYCGLIMRGVDDRRDDTIVKQEIYSKFFLEKNYDVMCAFDDRDRVVDMWRRNGVTCLQVNYGNF